MSGDSNILYTKIEEDGDTCRYIVTHKDPSLNWPKQDTMHIGFNALDYHRTFEFGIWKEMTNGDVLYCSNIEMNKLPFPDDHIPKPAFKLNKQEMQDLVEQIWMCGLRPKRFEHYIKEQVRQCLESESKIQQEKEQV